MEERIQKILSRAGFGSRRACEVLIEEGRVRVNSEVAQLGGKADAALDKIFVNNQPIPRSDNPKTYIALYKPRGVLSDIDPNDPRTTVRDLVPVPGHLFCVGRLDFDSEGLILLTDDGELANRLTHPRYGHDKEYRVFVASRPDNEQLAILKRGVVLADGHRTLPAKVFVEGTAGKGTWLNVILREGRKRQIREMCSQIGLLVQRIIRVRISTLNLGELKPSQWRYLRKEEIKQLQSEPEKPQKPKQLIRGR